MKNKSIVEEIFETAIKKPAVGFGISIVLAGLGFFLSSKQIPATAKTLGAAFSPLLTLIGVFCYMLSAVALMVSLIGFVRTYIKKEKQISFNETRKTLDSLKNASWKEFEEFVAWLFERLGYSVEVTGGFKDGGIDLVVKKGGRTSLVQCKNYRTHKVTLAMVRDFFGAMNAKLNFDAGYFVTTGIFTLEARRFAEDKPIELIDGAKLMEYVNMVLSKEAQEARL